MNLLQHHRQQNISSTNKSPLTRATLMTVFIILTCIIMIFTILYIIGRTNSENDKLITPASINAIQTPEIEKGVNYKETSLTDVNEWVSFNPIPELSVQYPAQFSPTDGEADFVFHKPDEEYKQDNEEYFSYCDTTVPKLSPNSLCLGTMYSFGINMTDYVINEETILSWGNEVNRYKQDADGAWYVETCAANGCMASIYKPLKSKTIGLYFYENLSDPSRSEAPYLNELGLKILSHAKFNTITQSDTALPSVYDLSAGDRLGDFTIESIKIYDSQYPDGNQDFTIKFSGMTTVSGLAWVGMGAICIKIQESDIPKIPRTKEIDSPQVCFVDDYDKAEKQLGVSLIKSVESTVQVKDFELRYTHKGGPGTIATFVKKM